MALWPVLAATQSLDSTALEQGWAILVGKPTSTWVALGRFSAGSLFMGSNW